MRLDEVDPLEVEDHEELDAINDEVIEVLKKNQLPHPFEIPGFPIIMAQGAAQLFAMTDILFPEGSDEREELNLRMKQRSIDFAVKGALELLERKRQMDIAQGQAMLNGQTKAPIIDPKTGKPINLGGEG